MNKILNINLGGYALTIDDDAHQYLDGYLDSIRRRFSESEGRDEIVGDIETRLGELISQSMGSRTIVMLPDAEAAVAVMGKPEDFGGEDTSSSKSTGSSTGATNKKSGKSAVRTGKRLFRDEDDAVVAGVCSGLSAYFGIQDPVWMRLIFVLLAFASFGFWMPAYVLIWILVAPAKTAADRLAMRGEQVNMDNIAREVEEGFDRLGKKVNEFGADAAKKGSSGAQNAMSTGVTAIGQAFGLLLRFLAKFAALIAILIGIAIFLGLGAGWIGSIIALMIGAPYVEYFSPFSSGWTWFGIINLFFLMGIPAIALVLFFSRLLFKTRTPAWVNRSLTGLFVISVITAFCMLPFGIKEYSQSGSISKNIDLSSFQNDTLKVVAVADLLGGRYHNQNDFNFEEDGIRIDDNGMEMRCPLEIRVIPSRDGQYHCTQIIKSQGSSSLSAQENADRVGYAMAFSGNTLQIPTAYSIGKSEKWRGQRVRVNIEVPVGKSITFDEDIHEYAGADLDEYDDINNNNYISRRPGKVFRMGNKGLVCADCPNMGDKDYRSDRNYEHFILEGDFTTEIRKGDDFRVEIEGPNGEKEKIQKIQTGDKITFTTNGKITNGAVRIFIQAPTFTSLHADNSGEITIRGFDEGTASITASGSSRIKAYLDVSSDFNIALSGKASLDLTGKGNNIDASLSDNAVLEATNWTADRVEISASDAARARVFAKDDALVLSTGQSSVRVDGGANVRNKRDDN
jgi:phage shock protein PspC (stress-responsive transcriptional regulator)